MLTDMPGTQLSSLAHHSWFPMVEGYPCGDLAPESAKYWLLEITRNARRSLEARPLSTDSP
jgi:hypothetical protein